MCRDKGFFRSYLGSESFSYNGDWLNNKMYGKGQLNFSNGASYIGEFRDDKANGRGVIITSTGKRIEGEFRNGEKLEQKNQQNQCLVYLNRWLLVYLRIWEKVLLIR